MPQIDDLMLVIAVSLAAFIYFGWTHRTNDSEAYHSDRRTVGRVRTIASLVTVVGAPHFPIFTTLTYFYGWWPVVFYLGTLTGFLVLTLVATRIRKYGPQDAYSFADIAALEIGLKPAFSLSVIGFIFTTGVVVTQIITGALLISAIAHMQYWVAVTMIAVTVLGYLYWGGYRALLFTDVIQFIMMFVLTAAFATYMWTGASQPGVLTPATEPASTIPLLPFAPMLYLGGVLVVLGAPEIWQRALTTRSDGIATSGFLISGVAMLLWGICVVAIGNGIHITHPTFEPSGAFIEFVSSALPHWMLGLVIVLLLVALLSTADTELFAASVIAQKELYRIRGTPSLRLTIPRTRITMVLLTALTLGGALAIAEDLNKFFGVLVNLGYVAGPLALSLVLRRGGRSLFIRRLTFYACLLASLSCFVYVWFEVGDFFSWWALAIMGTSSIRLVIPGAPSSGLTFQPATSQPTDEPPQVTDSFDG